MKKVKFLFSNFTIIIIVSIIIIIIIIIVVVVVVVDVVVVIIIIIVFWFIRNSMIQTGSHHKCPSKIQKYKVLKKKQLSKYAAMWPMGYLCMDVTANLKSPILHFWIKLGY